MKSIIKYPNKIFSVIILLFTMAFIASCGSNNSNNSNEVSSGTPVTITHPFQTNMNNNLVLNGKTIFLKKEIIRSTFQGFIAKVFKSIGEEVKRGDLLFKIETKELAGNDSLKLMLGDKTFLGEIEVKAKSDGILTKLDYHAGDFVSDGEVIAVISNPTSMRVQLNVPFENASHIKIGNPCTLILPGDKTIEGIIDKSIPEVDPETQTQIFLIKPKPYQNLPENLNLTVNVPYEKFNETTVVPKSSVISNVTEDSFWVMKLVNDTTAVRVDIQKGIENDSVAQIISPKLNISERIILSGAYGLPDTAKVEIVK